jgi:hypothetical protein
MALSVAVGGAGGGVALRRAATGRARLGAVLARAGRRVCVDDSTVTAGSEVCAWARDAQAIKSPTMNAAPISQRARRALNALRWTALLRLLPEPEWMLIVTSPRHFRN